MPNSHFNTLIIGQGLAGSLLAIELLQRGVHVMVIDNDHLGSASRVAAGLINPITGHRLNITDGFNHFFNTAQKHYLKLEKLLGLTLYSPLPQFRLLKNQGQFDYYQKRITQSDYESILGARYQDLEFFSDTGFGAIEIKQSVQINAAGLIAKARDYLISQGAYMKDKFDYTDFRLNDRGVRYRNFQAQQIVFCEGYQANNNPWLKALPFKLAKGEIIDVELNVANTHFLNWGNWLVPNPNGTQSFSSRLGATYEWHELTLESNEAQRRSLIESFQKQIPQEAVFGASQVGIRPATRDRKPFIGPLSELDHAYCFNGFGSKGCLTIPFYMQRFADHLLKLKPLDKELTRWL